MTGKDYKAEFVRYGLRACQVAAQVDLHPSVLSLYLNGKRHIPSSLAERLQEIIRMERERLEGAGVAG